MHTMTLDHKKRERLQADMLDKMPACGLKHIELDFSDVEDDVRQSIARINASDTGA